METTYQNNELRSTASGFALAGCILMSLLIIPMIWIIPMTIAIRRRIQDNQQVPLALSICYLIFGGLLCMVAAILLLVDYSKHQ